MIKLYLLYQVKLQEYLELIWYRRGGLMLGPDYALFVGYYAPIDNLCLTYT